MSLNGFELHLAGQRLARELAAQQRRQREALRRQRGHVEGDLAQEASCHKSLKLLKRDLKKRD